MEPPLSHTIEVQGFFLSFVDVRYTEEKNETPKRNGRELKRAALWVVDEDENEDEDEGRRKKKRRPRPEESQRQRLRLRLR